MSEDELHKLDRWYVDFSAAKVALHNIDVLLYSLVQSQNEMTAKLCDVFAAYSDLAGDGTEGQRAASQAALLDKAAIHLRGSTAKFSAKVSAQIQNSRDQVSTMGRNLHKLKSLKPPQQEPAIQDALVKVPEFLSVFDAFLARLTLELRIQQASFYKRLGDAFTHAGRAEPISSIKQTWITQFEQIMPAVESLKYVRPQVHVLDQQYAPPEHDGRETVLLAPYKWIHSRVTRDVRDFKFSDPRKGFFNKPTHPPKRESELVVATFDFEGQTESDLVFKRGNVIRVIDRGTEDDPNWWCGEFNGSRGLFPRNYVEEQRAPHPNEYIPRSPGRDAHPHRSGPRSPGANSSPRHSLDSAKRGIRPADEDATAEATTPAAETDSALSVTNVSDIPGSPHSHEEFGKFHSPDEPSSPKLPRRPSQRKKETQEDEHAPKLPKRPPHVQSSPSESANMTFTKAASDALPNDADVKAEVETNRAEADVDNRLSKDFAKEESEVTPDGHGQRDGEATALKERDLKGLEESQLQGPSEEALSPKLDNVSLQATNDASLKVDSVNSDSTKLDDGSQEATSSDLHGLGLKDDLAGPKGTSEPSVLGSPLHVESKKQSELSEHSGESIVTDQSGLVAPQDVDTALTPSQGESSAKADAHSSPSTGAAPSFDTDSEDDLQIPEELREDSRDDFRRQSDPAAHSPADAPNSQQVESAASKPVSPSAAEVHGESTETTFNTTGDTSRSVASPSNVEEVVTANENLAHKVTSTEGDSEKAQATKNEASRSEPSQSQGNDDELL